MRFKLVTNGTVKVLSHNDVSVYLGRQRGIKRMSMRPFPFLVVAVPSVGVFPKIREAKSVLLLVENEECVHEMCSFDWGPLCLPR